MRVHFPASIDTPYISEENAAEQGEQEEGQEAKQVNDAALVPRRPSLRHSISDLPNAPHPNRSPLSSTKRRMASCSLSAKEMSSDEVQAKLHDFVYSYNEIKHEGEDPDTDYFFETLSASLKLLTAGRGGIILVVLKSERDADDLQFDHLDGGALTDFWLQHARNIVQDEKAFTAILKAFCKHSDTDRWDEHALEQLAAMADITGGNVQESSFMLDKLDGQPKDGAIVLTHAGSVLLAAGHLRYAPHKFSFERTDGKSTGTRHAGALGCAEWLATRSADRPAGAVFVRSDSGGLHAMLPRCGGNLEIFAVTCSSSSSSESSNEAEQEQRSSSEAETSSGSDCEDEAGERKQSRSRSMSQPDVGHSIGRMSASKKNAIRHSLERGIPVKLLEKRNVAELRQYLSDQLRGSLCDEPMHFESGIARRGMHLPTDSSKGGRATSSNWSASFDAVCKVFRVPVPSTRTGVLGPEGLDLRRNFKIHAIAVEPANGHIEFEVLPSSCLNEGDFIWVGVGPGESSELLRFMDVAEFDRIQCAKLPVFSLLAPPWWKDKNLMGLSLPTKYGIKVVAIEEHGHTILFPHPDRSMKGMTKLWLSIASAGVFEANHKDFSYMTPAKAQKVSRRKSDLDVKPQSLDAPRRAGRSKSLEVGKIHSLAAIPRQYEGKKVWYLRFSCAMDGHVDGKESSWDIARDLVSELCKVREDAKGPVTLPGHGGTPIAQLGPCSKDHAEHVVKKCCRARFQQMPELEICSAEDVLARTFESRPPTG